MKKPYLIGILCLAGAILAGAHEFWLMPKKFQYKVGEEMQVAFLAGENFDGQPWDLSRHKVERLEIHMGITVKKLADKVTSNKGRNLAYTFDREGTHLVAVESNSAFSDHAADTFNTFLEDNGLERIALERKKAGKSGERAKESYKHFAKVIVQCGAKPDNTFRRSAGFRYEIFPLVNPAALKTGDYLDCLVTWEGKPASHAMVKVWSHVGNRIFLQNIYTEKDGTIKFPVSSSGPWMVSSVNMIPSEVEGADYQGFWASLVFEIKAQ